MKRQVLANGGATLALAMPLAACITMGENFLASAPPTMAMRLESRPPGAEARTSLGQTCRTPCSVNVAATDDFAVTFSLDGYQPQTVPVGAQPSDQESLEHHVGPDLMRAHTNRHNRGPTLDTKPVYAELRKAAPVRRHASRKPRPTAADETLDP
jgi:hypothetical protein